MLNGKPAKKGKLAEQIVGDWLREKGYIPYFYDDAIDRAHPFDILAASEDKKRILIAEVKGKPARKFYADTGVNQSNFLDYLHIGTKYKIPIFIFFVDEDKRQIYGNWLSKLEKPREEFNRSHTKKIRYPLIDRKIRYWPVSCMIKIVDLTNEQVEKLEELSTRSEKYKNNKKELFR